MLKKAVRNEYRCTSLFHFYEVPRVVKSIAMESRWWLQGLGVQGNGELLFVVRRVSVTFDERVMEMGGSDGYTTL